jgi:hypothetical protein
MVECAYALGMAFGQAAQAQTDTKHSLELAEAFQRSFQAVRLGIRLSMTLRSAPKPARPEREAVERDRIEIEALEREPLERERDREYEPVSLPKFLATLGVVAGDADRLGDRLPPAVRKDAIPALNDLLGRAKAGPADASAAASRPMAKVGVLIRPATSRAALLGSASPGFLPHHGPGRPRPPPRPTG